MASYLLECDCGNKVPVEIGQAGGRVICSCGTHLDVPPLRKLRHLPVAVAQETVAIAGWDKRKGVMAASLIVVAAICAFNFWSWYTQPAVPKFDPSIHRRMVEEQLKTLTPAEAWNVWLDYRLLAERGFSAFEASNRTYLERQIAHRQFLRLILWIVAAIFAATAAAAAFWPRSQLITSWRSD